jgi:predicted DNA-binding protein YlxM (UPF0122 family)
MPSLADKDHERLSRAWKTYQARRRRADNHRLKEAGYSMGDIGRELGMTRQAVYDLLRRAQADRS